MGIIGGPPIGGVGSMPGRGGPPVLEPANVSEKINIKTTYYHVHNSELHYILRASFALTKQKTCTCVNVFCKNYYVVRQHKISCKHYT